MRMNSLANNLLEEEEIFKKFERGQKESATPGVGLGLAA